jgi:ABC-type dipeptide/oligopeptide/nickel transport system ATPase subunit
LVGPSGSGKSTLAKAISGIITIQKGKIEWVNNTHRPKCQMIFQNPYSTCNPKMTICEILKEPLEINKISHDEKDIARQLAKVDLPETLLHKYPSELSSGQLQRVCIARALCTKPQLLIMDEAISSLDKLTKVEILHLLDKLIEEESISILFISHDISIANKFCHRIIDLNDK